jgi:hypothetical protein
MLPYWPDVKGAPQNTIIGGASLWVLQGHKAEGNSLALIGVSIIKASA